MSHETARKERSHTHQATTGTALRAASVRQDIQLQGDMGNRTCDSVRDSLCAPAIQEQSQMMNVAERNFYDLYWRATHIKLEFHTKRIRVVVDKRVYLYHPDFYCPQSDTHFEVIGTRQAYHANKKKILAVSEQHPSLKFKVVRPDGNLFTPVMTEDYWNRKKEIRQKQIDDYFQSLIDKTAARRARKSRIRELRTVGHSPRP